MDRVKGCFMIKLNSYEGFITDRNLLSCLWLACNDFTTDEISSFATKLNIDPTKDFYDISKSVFRYTKSLEGFYLSLTEDNSTFVKRIFINSKANQKLFNQYEKLLIGINRAKMDLSNSISKTNSEEKKDAFANAAMAFFHRVRQDFFVNDLLTTSGDKNDYNDGVFTLLLPVIHAAVRNCDFYRKEFFAKENKNEPTLILTDRQMDVLDQRLPIKTLETINANLEALEIVRESKNCQGKALKK